MIRWMHERGGLITSVWRDGSEEWIGGVDWRDGLEAWIGGMDWRDGLEG